MEKWKVLNFCSDYAVSNLGRLKSLKRGREKILSQSKTLDGYYKQALSINGKSITFRVHRLVAEHFIPNPDNKPTVNHIDGNKLNNNVENLEWSTLSEQMYHAYKNKLKKPLSGVLNSNSILTKDEVLEIRNTYIPKDKNFGMNALAQKFNVSLSTINKCISYRSYKDVK